jgi:hypothetical protein
MLNTNTQIDHSGTNRMVKHTDLPIRNRFYSKSKKTNHRKIQTNTTQLEYHISSKQNNEI